jgi:hypothetical protein
MPHKEIGEKGVKTWHLSLREGMFVGSERNRKATFGPEEKAVTFFAGSGNGEL